MGYWEVKSFIRGERERLRSCDFAAQTSCSWGNLKAIGTSSEEWS